MEKKVIEGKVEGKKNPYISPISCFINVNTDN